jgi:hypothetical protein
MTLTELTRHMGEDHGWTETESDEFCTAHRLSVRQLHDHEHAHGLTDHEHDVEPANTETGS